MTDSADEIGLLESRWLLLDQDSQQRVENQIHPSHLVYMVKEIYAHINQGYVGSTHVSPLALRICGLAFLIFA